MATPLQRQWSSGLLEARTRPVPAKPTKFDLVVRQLRLENDPQCWPISPTLKMWAKKHRNQFYVPEELLAAWKLHVLVED
jgi:hypothetical protein